LGEKFKYGDWELSLSPDSHPRTLMVEISTNCNYNCLHCFRNAVPDFKKCNMSYDTLELILRKGMEAGVSKLVLSGWGEPSSNPKMIEMLRTAKELGFTVALNTNGSALEDMAEELVGLGVDEVFVSIDAYDIKLYRDIRKPGDLSKVMRGLKKLLELKIEKGSVKPQVNAIFTITKLNVGEVSRSIELTRDLGISEIRFSNYIHYPGGVDLSCIDDEGCLEKLKGELDLVPLKILEGGVKVVIPNLAPTTYRSCPFFSNRALFIRCDGIVSPCIYYSRNWRTKVLGVERRINEVILGDIKREGLIDIWRKSYKMFFRLYFLRLPSCLDCNLVNYCLITRSNETDCWGNKPSCSHCPYLHGLSYCPL